MKSISKPALVAGTIVAAALMSSAAKPQAAGAAKPKREPECTSSALPAVGSIPFRVGEELSYELKVGNVYIGRMDTKVGQPRTMQGRRVMTLFGRARTNAFIASYKEFEGRYMSFVDPETFRPAAVRVESRYGDEKRWERVTFQEGETAVRAAFLHQGKEGTRAYDRELPLFDMLSILYFARTRELAPGLAACHEVYVDRRLWRMKSKVRGMEKLSTPAGKKKAYVIEARLERLPHPDFDPKAKTPWMEMEIFISADDAHVPLAFVARNQRVTGRGELTSWSLDGRGAEGPWEF